MFSDCSLSHQKALRNRQSRRPEPRCAGSCLPTFSAPKLPGATAMTPFLPVACAAIVGASWTPAAARMIISDLGK
jgi:hypothetical protein